MGLLVSGDLAQLSTPPKRFGAVDSIKYPAVAAHRGGRALYPEGSMAAFKAIAREHPGMVLEMDVRPLKDGTLVVCHDATVDRIAVGKTGKVSDMTQTQWRALQVQNTDGTMVGPAAFLSDVLNEFGGTNTVLMIELKDQSDKARSQYISQCWFYRSQIISASFDPKNARTLAGSGFSGQYLASKPPVDGFPAWASHVALSDKYVTPQIVADAHANGARLWVWTVNDVARKTELLAMGADGIMTDNPNT
ncbi:glycerophosphodiester phosphodiesterase [Arthrobacter rhombi]|uniref:glycerophosphodiester phosphodiesterase n=1 Tax=Arthrobacter rhombi TaxID=71253 RepID=UPI003FCF271A